VFSGSMSAMFPRSGSPGGPGMGSSSILEEMYMGYGRVKVMDLYMCDCEESSLCFF